ncbi:MAG: PilZ domain-containing protein [Pseudomonadota bacterium]
MMFKRRKFERETVTDCIVEFVPSGWKCHGEVHDISEAGMRVDIDQTPEMNEEAQLRMTCGSGRSLNKKAIVIWFIKKVPPEVGAMVGMKFI